MKNLPDAYCVKCKNHTSTLKKQTVMLASSARAVTGKCPRCGSSVYKILSPKSSVNTTSHRPKSNLVSINHHRWTQPELTPIAARPKTAIQPLSFIGGMLAGVLAMTAAILLKSLVN